MQQIRRENIKELLRSTGFVNVQEIAGQFGVTAETVRRDLEALERYKKDPRHVAVSTLCKSIREARGAVDFEI